MTRAKAKAQPLHVRFSPDDVLLMQSISGAEDPHDALNTPDCPPRKKWTEVDIALLCDLYPDSPTAAIAARLDRPIERVYAFANKLGLRKSKAFLASPAAHRLDGRIGKDCRFKPGLVPANKGLRRPGWAPGRMASTQFKAGVKPANTWRPIGTEVCVDGYWKVKVSDSALPGQSRFDWKMKHVLVWEQANGPVPTGSVIVFRDGNRNHIEPANLECVSRAELQRRNSYHTRYPKEIGLLIQARGALQRQINKLEKANEKQS